MRDAIIFDDGLGKLGSLTDLRAAFDIRTGAWTTAWRLRRMLDLNILGFITPASLAAVTNEYHLYGHQLARGPSNLPALPPGALLINGRCGDRAAPACADQPAVACADLPRPGLDGGPAGAGRRW